MNCDTRWKGRHSWRAERPAGRHGRDAHATTGGAKIKSAERLWCSADSVHRCYFFLPVPLGFFFSFF